MRDYRNRLLTKRLLLSDGAWGTELSRHGLPAGTAPERWNLDFPERVQAVAAAYVAAGADIILTNTFGGSAPKLEKAGLAGRVDEVNRAGAMISRRAAGDRALVFASIGPTGEFLAPLGEVQEDEMRAWFGQQAKALLAGGADGIVIESMSDLEETRIALAAARAQGEMPVVCSLTFAKGPRGYATMMGVRPGEAARQLTEAGADILGVNCGAGIADAVAIVRELRAHTMRPIWAKPNAGLPELVGGQTVFKETPEMMAAHLPALVEAGASIVGGCCGTTPEHIACLARKAPLCAPPSVNHIAFRGDRPR